MLLDTFFLPFGESVGATKGYLFGSVTYNNVADKIFEKITNPGIYNTFDLYDANRN